MHRLLTLWEQSWTVCKKDIRVWLRHPSNILITLLPALALLLIGALGSAAVGHSPVALVVRDKGVEGTLLAQTFRRADVFRIYDVDDQQGQRLLRNVEVAALIIIPADFTQRVHESRSAPIEVTINNLNLDFTNDIRRAVPDVITQFYARRGGTNVLKVTLAEHDLRQRDIELFQYSVLPTLLFQLTISGLVTGSLTTAREWESQTITELLLAPIERTALIAGKTLASFLTTFLLGLAVLCLCAAAGWVQPEGIYWLSTLLILALVSLFGAALGIAIGTFVRRVQPVSPIAINIGMYLFFLTGGVGVLAFEPVALQNIADWLPLSYGRHALEMAVFYHSTDQLGRDLLVLCLSASLSVLLGVVALRKGLAS